MNTLLTIVSFFILASNESSFTTGSTNQQDTISYKEIYSFVKDVLADSSERFDHDYGIRLSPEPNCGFDLTDSVYLKSLLLDKGQTKITNHTPNGLGIIRKVPKCLTSEDIHFMLTQKRRLKTFKWDNSYLKFNQSNTEYYYSFSLPLFSVDKQKALIYIREHCPGLCGTEQSVLFIKQNGKWKFAFREFMIH